MGKMGKRRTAHAQNGATVSRVPAGLCRRYRSAGDNGQNCISVGRAPTLHYQPAWMLAKGPEAFGPSGLESVEWTQYKAGGCGVNCSAPNQHV